MATFRVHLPDSDQPLYCLVMEKIDGPNLKQWMVQQGNHPISEKTGAVVVDPTYAMCCIRCISTTTFTATLSQKTSCCDPMASWCWSILEPPARLPNTYMAHPGG